MQDAYVESEKQKLSKWNEAKDKSKENREAKNISKCLRLL